jgi:hypothetical protein
MSEATPRLRRHHSPIAIERIRRGVVCGLTCVVTCGLTCVAACLVSTLLLTSSTSAEDEKPKQGLDSPPRAETGAGRWVRPLAEPAEAEEQGLIDRLLAIGYLQGSRDSKASGVTIHDETRAAAGFNLYSSGHAPEATLIDMQGKQLHRWRLPYEEAFGALAEPDSNAEWWRRVHLLPNGSLLAIFEGMGLIKIDKNSKLVWKTSLRAHHDLEVQPNGDIYLLTRDARMIPRLSEDAPILEDFIMVLSRTGRPKLRISLVEAFEKSRFHNYLAERKRRDGDIIHTNTITVLPGDLAKQSPAFAKGNLLVSLNTMGIIAIIDPGAGRVVWLRKTPAIGQHDPKLLSRGTMLIFNNYIGRDASEVLEFHPRTNETIWSYEGSSERPFYSKFLGAAERLWNGNTLITESDGGRAFEVTPDKEIVWEFYNPNRAGAEGEYIATLPEVVRLPPDFPLDWLSGAGS